MPSYLLKITLRGSPNLIYCLEGTSKNTSILTKYFFTTKAKKSHKGHNKNDLCVPSSPLWLQFLRFGLARFLESLLRVFDLKHSEYETLKSQIVFFDFDHFDVEKVNRKFGVPNPISVSQYSENELLRFKVTHSKQEDHLYRLGQKLRQYIK